MNKTKAKEITIRIASIFLDIIAILTILIAPTIIYNKIKKTPATIFGYTISTVVSGSMINSGFNLYDGFLVKKINPSKIKKGDKICFYYTKTNQPSSTTIFNSESNTYSSSLKFNLSTLFGINNEYYLDSAKNNYNLCFHQVNEVFIDENGELWFQTFGTSNIDSNGEYQIDEFLTNENYVVGKYVCKLPILSCIIKMFVYHNFLYYIYGIIVLIIIYEVVQLIIEIRKGVLISKLISKKINITDKHFTQKFFKSVDIKDKEKILETANPSELDIYNEKMFAPEQTKQKNTELKNGTKNIDNIKQSKEKIKNIKTKTKIK